LSLYLGRLVWLKKEKDDPIKEPFIELPLQAQKVRRNLLTFSLATLGIIIFGEIKGQATLLGIKGPPLNPCNINLCLLLITLYFLIYFVFLGHNTTIKMETQKYNKNNK